MAVGIIDAAQAPGFVDFTQAGGNAPTPSFDVMKYVQEKNAEQNAPGGDGGAAPAPVIDPRELPQITRGTTLADLAQRDAQLANYDQAMADFQRRYQAAAAQVEQDRQRAGNPLNRIASGVQGVLGLPFRLLENVVGGENNDLSAPFRPQQTANSLAQARMAQLDNARSEFVKDIATARSQRVGLLSKVLEDQGKKAKEAYGIAAGAATLALQADNPQQFFAQTMASGAADNPMISQLGLDKLTWGQDLPRKLAALAGDKETFDRLDNATKVDNVTVPDGGTLLRLSRNPNVSPQALTSTGVDINLNGFQAPRFAVGQPSAAPMQQSPTAMYETPPANIPRGNPNGNAPVNASNDGVMRRAPAMPRPQGKSNDQLLNEANEAIRNGADFNAVMQRLKDWGVQ